MKPTPIKTEILNPDTNKKENKELCALNSNCCKYFKINITQDKCYSGDCILLGKKLYYVEGILGDIMIFRLDKCKEEWKNYLPF